MAIRVVIADDSLLVREGVRALLAEQADLDVVALAGDLPELLRSVASLRPDVVVTDICMPPTNTDEGIRAAIELRRTRPGTGVVVLSQYDDSAHAGALFADGVARRAYLLKERLGQPNQLAEAVRAVAAGDSVIDPRIVEAMLSSRSRRTAVQQLTAREREVLAEMATGANNTKIAGQLFITVRAVERHINSIFAKLGLAEDSDSHHRVQAVLLYLAEGR